MFHVCDFGDACSVNEARCPVQDVPVTDVISLFQERSGLGPAPRAAVFVQSHDQKYL